MDKDIKPIVDNTIKKKEYARVRKTVLDRYKPCKNGRPLKYATPNDMTKVMGEYLGEIKLFNSKQDNPKLQKRITMSGLKLKLALNNFDNYLNKPEFVPIIEGFIDLIVDERQQYTGEPEKDKFILKNIASSEFKDKIEVESNINTQFNLVDLHKEVSSLLEQEDLESRTIIEADNIPLEDTNNA